MNRAESKDVPAREALQKALRGLTPAMGMKLIRRLKQCQSTKGRPVSGRARP